MKDFDPGNQWAEKPLSVRLTQIKRQWINLGPQQLLMLDNLILSAEYLQEQLAMKTDPAPKESSATLGDTPRTDALLLSQERRSAIYFPLRLEETIALARTLERELAETATPSCRCNGESWSEKCVWPKCGLDPATGLATPSETPDTVASSKEHTAEVLLNALRPLAALGGPDDGCAAAFHDLPDDTVVCENGGDFITAGDVRWARKLVSQFYRPKPSAQSAIGEWRPMIELPSVLLRTEMLFKTEHQGRDGLTHTHHEILLVWPDGVLTDHSEAVVPPEETPSHFMRIPK